MIYRNPVLNRNNNGTRIVRIMAMMIVMVILFDNNHQNQPSDVGVYVVGY